MTPNSHRQPFEPAPATRPRQPNSATRLHHSLSKVGIGGGGVCPFFRGDPAPLPRKRWSFPPIAQAGEARRWHSGAGHPLMKLLPNPPPRGVGVEVNGVIYRSHAMVEHEAAKTRRKG